MSGDKCINEENQMGRHLVNIKNQSVAP